MMSMRSTGQSTERPDPWSWLPTPTPARFMAERMQARMRSHDVDHAPLISRPTVVIDILREAINHVATDLEKEGQ